jgi:hypothetical protein
MNERIQELMKQSMVEYQFDLRFSPEKFAELIVKECGVALSPMLRDMISRGQAFDLIKKHFGVRE